MKSSRLTERINQLESKINSNKFPSERERVLRWRLTKLQEKLVFVQEMKESLANSQQTPETEVAAEGSETTPVSADVATPNEEEKSFCHKGGRRGRGGRGGCRRAMMEDGNGCHVRGRKCGRVAPEILANFRQCKATLRAAREAGNPEEIQAALEALQAAKATKWEAMAAGVAQEATSTDEQTA
jgi:hypothetical protein